MYGVCRLCTVLCISVCVVCECVYLLYANDGNRVLHATVLALTYKLVIYLPCAEDDTLHSRGILGYGTLV